MNKLFTLLSACGFAIAANAQTIYFEDDFEAGSLTGNNAWTTQVVADPDVTGLNWEYGTVGGNYARCTNYNGANHVLNTWLISPAFSLTGATQPMMSFDMTKRYAGDDIVVQISNDYDGSSAPGTATWTDITSLFTLDANTGSWNFVGSGDGDLTPYINATTYIAFEYVGSATDGSTWEVDNVVIQEGPTVIPVLSIYDIQYTLNSPADSPEKGNEVTTSGVVTALNVAPAIDGYYIQDADGSWNGIFVVDSVNTAPSVGDSVEITGTVKEFFNMTRFEDLTAFTNHGASTWQPTASSITTNDAATLEEYESVLVTVTDAECTDDNPGFGLWTVNDGSGAVNVDDDCYDNSGVLGNYYELTGPISYTYSEFKINPRTGADITVTGNASVEENTTEISIYPNPATDNVVINAQPNALVSIYSMTGAVVMNGVSNMTLDVSNLDAGVYQVVITEGERKLTQKLIVK